MKSPKTLKPYIFAFCHNISKTKPITILHQPVRSAAQKDCFNIVEEHIRTHGGNRVIGWAIWEWPKIMIEAEFHCVWEHPSGHLLDLTPRPIELKKIMFLPDTEREYLGRQVNNIRKPLKKSPLIQRYIAVNDQIFTEMNKGDLAYHHGEIELTETLLKLDREKQELERQIQTDLGTKRRANRR